MKTDITLPDKLSELIEVALKDYIEVKRKKKTYRISMGVWHQPVWTGTEDKSICAVCLAGCVMANTFNISNKLSVSPGMMLDFTNDKQVDMKLRALDSVRVGYVATALRWIGFNPDNISIPEFKNPCGDNLISFIPRMRKIVKWLKSQGL